MIKKFKKITLTLSAIGMLLTPVLAPAMVSAVDATTSPDKALCEGANLGDAANCDAGNTAATEKINSILKLVINLFSLLVGVVSVIMIIIGGLKYITSGGDSGHITSAKNTIIYAIIGLVIVALAQFIVRFVLGKVSAS